MERNFSIYDSFDDFSMVGLKNLLLKERLESPLCESVNPTSVLAFAASVVNWSLLTLDHESLRHLNQTIKFDINAGGTVHGLTFWFTVGFHHPELTSLLDTSPYLPETHWKQTTAFLPRMTSVNVGDHLIVTVDLKKSEQNHRWYDITLTQKSLIDRSVRLLHGEDIVSMEEDLDPVHSDEELIGDDDPFAALVDALSEKFDADREEIAGIIAQNAFNES